MKKVLQIEVANPYKNSLDKYDEEFKKIQERMKLDPGASVRNAWPHQFFTATEDPNDKYLHKAPVGQEIFGYCIVGPYGRYLYYTESVATPRSFADNMSNYELFRYELNQTGTEQFGAQRIVSLGNVPSSGGHKPIRFIKARGNSGKKGDTGYLFVVAHNEDNNDDGAVDFNDKKIVYRFPLGDPSGQKAGANTDLITRPGGKKMEAEVKFDSDMNLVSVSYSGTMLAFSTQKSRKPRSYLYDIGSKKKIDMPAGFEIAHMMFDGGLVILSKTVKERGRSFSYYDFNIDELTPINIDPEFLKSGNVSLVHVLDMRGKQIYLTRLQDTNGDGKFNYKDNTAIFTVDLSIALKRGEFIKPKQLTPAGESAIFMTTSVNKFLFYRSGRREKKKASVVYPHGGEPEPLCKIGSYIHNMQFSASYEYLTFIKTYDSDGDGIPVVFQDKSEIFYYRVPVTPKK